MNLTKSISAAGGLLLLFSFTCLAQDKSTGAIKGKVRVEKGSPAGVAIIVRQGEREIARTNSDRKGDFLISRIPPGMYGVTFRKPGLSVGAIENVEVRAGKTRSLGDHLILTVDEGSLAFIRGSVFTPEGRSAPNVRVELSRILDDGSLRKLDARITSETGQFVFRLPPDAAKYRLTLKAEGSEPVTTDLEVDGAGVFRAAMSLKPPSK